MPASAWRVEWDRGQYPLAPTLDEHGNAICDKFRQLEKGAPPPAPNWLPVASWARLSCRYAPHEDPFTTNFYTGATGMAIATPILLATVADPFEKLMGAPGLQLGALMAVAVLGTTGHLLLIMALGKAPASTLMPFQYVQLAVAALAGFFVSGVIPDAWGWIGMAIIGICGAASAWLNVRAAAAKLRPVSAVQADTIAE